MTRDHWKERRAKNPLRFLLSRKSPSLQYCRYLLYTVAAIFRGKPPYYQKLPPPFMRLAADRLRENYPHKSWRLKSRGVWPRRPRHGNVEYPLRSCETPRNISSYTADNSIVSASFSHRIERLRRRRRTIPLLVRESLLKSDRYARKGYINISLWYILFRFFSNERIEETKWKLLMKPVRLFFFLRGLSS